MEKIDMKKDIRYVIGTMDEVPMFLRLDFSTRKYFLTDNVAVATKATSKEAARETLTYYKELSVDDRPFAILPVEVNYRLLDNG